MNPTDFVELANTLVANPREAAQRSAVSRAYYGAFNATRALIESCGFSFSNSAETHEKLPWCLERSGDRDLNELRVKLHTLRRLRNAADYDMDDPRFADRRFALVQVEIARKLIDGISAAKARLPSFREAVRNYAQNVLGKTLELDE